MATIKTAISIEKPLFEQVEALAEELEVSRSHVFMLAAQEFVERHQSRKLLDSINKAYDDLPDAAEQTVTVRMRNKQRKAVKDQW